MELGKIRIPGLHRSIWQPHAQHAGVGLKGDGADQNPAQAEQSGIGQALDDIAGKIVRAGQSAGPKACPFNYLYWNFLAENETKLGKNPRLAMPYRTLAKMTVARRAEIAGDAADFLEALVPWQAGD